MNGFFLLIGISLLFSVLVFAAFFLWRWLFRKFIPIPKRRKIITWTVTALSIPPLFFAAVALYFVCASWYPDRAFNKAIWNYGEKRYEVSEDIIESKLLIGKTKAEVRELLGQTDEPDAEDTWYYYLGYPPGQLFGIDPDALSVMFKLGKVTEVNHIKG